MEDYLRAALHHAQYEHDSDGSAYGQVRVDANMIVSATGRSFAACRAALRRTLHDEIMRALRSERSLPPIDGIAPPAA